MCSSDLKITFFHNNGDGTFRQSTYSSPGIFGSSIGDFDADGKADLAIVSMDSQTVSIALGNGNGTFQTLTGTGGISGTNFYGTSFTGSGGAQFGGAVSGGLGLGWLD